MTNRLVPTSTERMMLLAQASADFFFLLNRNYPRPSALQLVGNRYGLTDMERQLLHRGIFRQEVAMRRRAKRCQGSDWRREWLVVDGHNVQITVESAIIERTLLKANDGALRDLAGQSSRFRFSEVSETALDYVFGFLEEFRPRQILFLFDAPMSHSGLLADIYRQRLKAMGLSGEARAVPVPEREFPYDKCVMASSDGAVLDAAARWVDLACAVICRKNQLRLTVDFSSILLAREGGPFFPIAPELC